MGDVSSISDDLPPGEHGRGRPQIGSPGPAYGRVLIGHE